MVARHNDIAGVSGDTVAFGFDVVASTLTLRDIFFVAPRVLGSTVHN